MPGEDQKNVSIRAVARVLRRRLWLIVACSAIAPAVAVGASLLQEKQYRSSATLLFRDVIVQDPAFGTPFTPQDAAREAATNARLVGLGVVAERAVRRLGAQAPNADLTEKTEIAAQGASDLVSVTVTDDDPAFAARAANVLAEEFIAFRRESDRKRIDKARALVENTLEGMTAGQRRSPRGTVLQQRSEQLQTLARLQTGNAELVQPARPAASPFAPRPLRSGFLGLLLGLLAGAGAALLVDRLDRRLRDPNDVEELFRKPVLGAIPESDRLPNDERVLAPGGREADAFRMLRANLRYFNVDRELKSILVTSGAPGEGKSTVSWHLAEVAALSGARVLLIEADLRHPVFAGRYGVDAPKGLSGYLSGSGELAQYLTTLPLSTSAGKGAAEPKMDVLGAGPKPPNPAELLESERARLLFDSAEAVYDLVIVDSPPAALVPDVVPILTRVSGILVVSRLGKSTRPAATHLRNQLVHLGAPLLGLVINSVTSDAGGYDTYGYGYGYGATTNGDDPARSVSPKTARSEPAVRERA